MKQGKLEVIKMTFSDIAISQGRYYLCLCSCNYRYLLGKYKVSKSGEKAVRRIATTIH